MPQQELSLDHVEGGHRAIVVSVEGEGPRGMRLREMGFVAGAWLEVITQGDTLLLKVGDGRLGLSAELAGAVRVLAA